MNHPTILVVEDNPITRKMFRVALETEGYTALEAPDGRTALALMAKRPDLVFQDLILPDMDGFDLLKRLRALPGGGEIPIVAVSGFLSRMEQARSLEVGFADFLFKPVEPSRLINAVQTYLAASRGDKGQPGRGRLVLVADDDPIQRKLLKIRLEQLGFQVATAADGLEAVTEARRAVPDAIVSDVLMPELDGFRLCHTLRLDPQLGHVPIVLATASYTNEADRRLAEQVGATRFVVRRPNLEEVIDALLASLTAPRPTPTPKVELPMGEYAHRLIRQLERQAALSLGLSSRLALREAELAILAGLAQTLGEAVDGERVLADVLHNALNAAGMSHGAIYLFDAQGDLTLAAQLAMSEPDRAALLKFLSETDAVRRAIRDLEVTIVPSPAVPADRVEKLLARAGVKSLIVTPLSSRAQRLGVLVMLSSVRDPTEDWLTFANALGGQVGQAITLSRTLSRLAASETRYRLIVETASEGIWLVDDEGKTIFANQRMAEMLGSTTEGLLGASLLDFLDDEEREAIIANIEWRRIGNPVRREVRFRRRDGTRFWTLLSASQVNDEKGLYVGILVMIADITERKLAEEALRQAEERYRALMEYANDGVLILDLQGRILEANREMEVLLGRPRMEIIGRYPWDFGPPGEEGNPSEQFKEFLARGAIHLTRPMRRGDGTVASVEISGALVEVGGEQIVIAIHRDITERLRAEETVRQTEKLAAMGTLVAGVAHELNNPLSVVIGQAWLLREATKGSPLAQRVEKITQAAERSARIVKNFLALARQYPPERRKVELNQTIQEVIELLAYPLRMDNVEVKLDLAPDLPALWADPHQIHQVLVNLVTNAHQAMRETPPPRRLTLTTRFEPAPGRVSLEVADTGPGIPPPVRARIFEPFFTTKPAGQGTGLGLSLCLGIIEEHRGTIRVVETPPGGGTTFRIELPVDPRTAKPEVLAVETQPAIRGKTVLVVDDEPEIAEILRDMLAIDGHQVTAAANGVIALNALREGNYDLILSDLKMPELDGPGLYREIERSYPGLRRRVIFITGDALSPETREFLANTEARSVGKPFALDEVRRVILQALRGI